MNACVRAAHAPLGASTALAGVIPPGPVLSPAPPEDRSLAIQRLLACGEARSPDAGSEHLLAFEARRTCWRHAPRGGCMPWKITRACPSVADDSHRREQQSRAPKGSRSASGTDFPPSENDGHE
jgi:hypothetical protein